MSNLLPFQILLNLMPTFCKDMKVPKGTKRKDNVLGKYNLTLKVGIVSLTGKRS